MPNNDLLHVFGVLDRIANDAVEFDRFRLEVGGRAFYGHRAEFANPELLELLEPGDKLFLCCHGLKGGGYLAHWLASEKDFLVPAASATRIPWEILLFLAGTGLVLFGLPSLLASGLSGGRFPIFAAINTVAGAILVLLGSRGLPSLPDHIAAHFRQKRAARRSLKRFQGGRGGIPDFAPASSLPMPHPEFRTDLLANFDEELETLRGEARGVRFTRVRQADAARRIATERVEYQFTCSGKSVGWTWESSRPAGRIATFAATAESPHFLAEGDRIAATIRKKTGRRGRTWFGKTSTSRPGDAAVLINESGGRIHLSPDVAAGRPPAFRLIHLTPLWGAIIAAMLYVNLRAPFPGLSIEMFLAGVVGTGFAAGAAFLAEMTGLWRLRRTRGSRISTDIRRAIAQTDGFTRAPGAAGGEEFRVALVRAFRPLAVLLLCAYAAIAAWSRLP